MLGTENCDLGFLLFSEMSQFQSDLESFFENANSERLARTFSQQFSRTAAVRVFEIWRVNLQRCLAAREATHT